MEAFVVEPTGANEYGRCSCCGNDSRCVWGLISTSNGPLAAYYVQWTLGRVEDHGANFDLILGKWGEQATASDRYLVSLAYRLFDNGPQFMVIDGDERPAAQNQLVGRVLRRTEIVGQPIAQQAFAAVGAILAQDPRVLELLGPHRMA